MGQSTEKQGKSKPRLVVLPFQPQEGQAYDRTGLAIHFLLGNIMAIHTGLKEFWFGWRVKNIFPEKEMLRAYCRGEGSRPDATKLGKEQDIRYWLQGRIQQKGDKIQVFLELTDTKKEHIEQTTDLTFKPKYQLTGFHKGFMAWLETCGLPLPGDQAAKALWHEKTNLESLDFLGRALKAFYLHSSWGEKGLLDLELLNRAAEESFQSALNLNSNGLGALAGLRWCAIYTNDEEKAYKWAVAKADIRGESRDAAKALVARKMNKD